jgi:hypothetical protein
LEEFVIIELRDEMTLNKSIGVIQLNTKNIKDMNPENIIDIIKGTDSEIQKTYVTNLSDSILVEVLVKEENSLRVVSYFYGFNTQAEVDNFSKENNDLELTMS